jgi:hypothetical protein
VPAEGATSLPPKVLSAPGLVGQEPTLKSQEDGLRFGTGQQNLPGVAGNIAEYYDILSRRRTASRSGLNSCLECRTARNLIR